MRYALLCALAGLLVDARAAEPGSPEPVQSIWKDQEFSFYFQSQTTFYSCSSLEAKRCGECGTRGGSSSISPS